MSMKITVDPPSLNLDEVVEIGAFYFEEDPFVLYVECKPAERYTYACPECGCISEHTAYGFGKQRRIHDISMGVQSIDILLRPRRYRCNDCGTIFRQPLNFVETNKWMTKRLIDRIQMDALTMPFKQVAREYGITIPTVSEIIKEFGVAFNKERTVVAPRVLGIDENHISNTMRGIFTDIEKGTLLDMTIDNKKATMQAAIENMVDYDTNIELVCMDMSRGYKGVVEECLPNAKIIVDKFHVVRYIYKATERARKEIFAHLKEEVQEIPDPEDKDRLNKLLTRMGHDAYLFKFSTARVKKDASRTSLLAHLCKEFPELNELRITKERAEKIYESKNQYEAAENINQFIKNIPEGPEYEDFRSLKKTLNNWMPEILNYFKYDCKYTNAPTEGVNSLVKELNSVGRGYSFDNLRTKALAWPQGQAAKQLSARKKPSMNFMLGFLSDGHLRKDTGVSVEDLRSALQILF